MAIKVGSAFVEFYLKYDGLQEGSEKARKHLRDLQGSAKGTAASVEAANARIAKSFEQLQAQLAGVDPFSRLTAAAAAAYDKIVGHSIIPEMRKDVVAEVNRLREQLAAARAFDPLTTQAAQAAAAAQAEMDELLEHQKALQESIQVTGIKRPDLDTFFDDEGRIRDAIQTTDATFEESQRKHLRGTGGRTISTTAQDARIGGLIENADRGTRLASAEDIQAAKDLAEETRDLYSELDQANHRLAELRQLTDAAGKGSINLGRTFLGAQEALDEYSVASDRATKAQQAVQAGQARIAQLEQRYTALSDAADTAAAGTNRHTKAQALADRTADQYSEALQRQTALEHASAQADLQKAAALDRIRQAQTELNSVAAKAPDRAAPAARQGAGRSDLEKQAQLEEQRRLRAIEQEQEAQRKAALEDQRSKNAIRETQERNIASLRVAEIQTTADVEKARLNTTAIVEAAEKQRVARVYEADQKVEQQRVRGASRLTEIQSRGDQTRATLAQQIEGKLTQIREAGAQRLQAIQQRFLNQQQRDTDKAAKAQASAAQRGTGLSAEGTSLVKRFQAEKNYQAALSITKKRLDETNLSEVQRNNLLALQTKIQDRASAAQKGAIGLTGLVKQGVTQLAGALGLATVGYMAIAQVAKDFKESLSIEAETKFQVQNLGAMIGSQDRANRSWDAARGFAAKYNFTLTEMSQTLGAIAPLIRTSTVETEKQLEVLARLTTRQPSQGIGGAAFALNELQSGDTQSIKERFNIPIRLANQMKREILAGADAFLVMDKYLNQLGNTEAVLGERTEGLRGAMLALKSANTEVNASYGEMLGGPMTEIIGEMARMRQDTAKANTGIRTLFSANPGELVEGFRDANRELDFMERSSGFGTLVTVFQALGLAGSTAAERIAESGSESEKALARLSDQVTVATNKFEQGKLSAGAYATVLSQLREDAELPAPINTFGSMGQLQSIETMQQRLTELQTQMRQSPEFAKQFLPEAELVAQKIAELKRLSPVEITVEMQLQFLGDASAIMQETLSQARQVQDQLASLDSGHAERLQGITDQSGKLWRNYLRDRADANTSYIREQHQAETRFGAQQNQEASRFYGSQSRDLIRFTAGQAQAYGDFYASATRDLQRFNAAQAQAAGDFYSGAARDLQRFNATQAQASGDFYSGAARDLQRFNAQQAQDSGDFYRNAARDLQRFNAGQAEAVEDFQRGQRRSRRNFERAERQAEEDYRRGLARAARDQMQAEQDAEEDHARGITEVRANLGKKLEDIARETRQRLQDIQREFDVDRSRSSEDFTLERNRLLAEGRIAEARVLESRFGVEQRRKEEDLARSRSGIVDTGATGAQEARADVERQIAEDEANRARQQERERRQRAQAAADQEEDFQRGRERARAQFEEQAAEAAADFGRQQERARANFAQQQADAAAAFALQQERARANFAQQQADAEQAFELQQQRARANFAQQQADAEQAFGIQQARARENFEQQQTDAEQAFLAQQAAAKINFDQQQTDAAAAFALQQSDARANFDQQQADADAAHKESLRKMEEAWREQFLELVAQRKAEVDQHAAARKEILDGYDQFLLDQESKLDQAAQTILDIQKLIDAGMTKEAATLEIRLREQKKQFAELLGEMERELGPAGGRAATSYMREFARALEFGATETDKALQRQADAMIPRSPIKRGPLKDHEAGARRAGQMYTRAFAQGLSDPSMLGALSTIRERLDTRPTSADVRSLATGNGGGGGGGRTIVIQLNAGVQMDGRTVGQIVAPHVASQFEDDLEVSAQVVESVFTPGVHQQAFRRPT